MKLLATLVLIATLVPHDNYNMDLTQTNKPPYTYLALGDSYTIGESVSAEGSFPYQLAAELTKAKHPVSQPDIIATTGWTTDELINAINNSDKKDKKYDLVTLLIGVNNQYRGYNQETYRTEFIHLLNAAILHANGSKNHVFVLSIPDWGVTPYADSRDRSQIAKEINQFNAINKQETQKAGVAYIDITPISKQAANDPSLNAEDGLHPSAKMYCLWVRELLPVIEKGLK
jgi:lysophospholipase L1-like esterase